MAVGDFQPAAVAGSLRGQHDGRRFRAARKATNRRVPTYRSFPGGTFVAAEHGILIGQGKI